MANCFAAIDLGSNLPHGGARVYVPASCARRPAARDGPHGRRARRQRGLDPVVLARALECLSRFGERIPQLTPHRVRAIATNPCARCARRRLPAARRDRTGSRHRDRLGSRRSTPHLPRVAQGLPPTGKQRLVIDIGGGSTEFSSARVSSRWNAQSLQMGCVATTRRFFADGKLSRKR